MLAEFLRHGEANAIATAELVRLTGCSSARELQSLIADERARGEIILSTSRAGGGYFLPADGAAGRQELARFCATMRARALNTLAAMRPARRALRELDGQISISNNGEGKL